MSNFNTNKPTPHGLYPVNHEIGGLGAGFTRVEPWISPEKLRSQYLFGVPLTSSVVVRDQAITQELSDDDLKDFITRAAAEVEMLLGIQITPTVLTVKKPFDRTKSLQGWGQIDLGVKPITNILELSVRSPTSYMTYNGNPIHSNPSEVEGTILYNVPLNYIDMSLAFKGIIHITPLMSSLTDSASPALFLGPIAPFVHIMNSLYNNQQVPGFWFIRYVTGFQENSIPAPVNDLIATVAALNIISAIGPRNLVSGSSIGLDGASQSVSINPGVLTERVQFLEAKKEKLVDLLRAAFTNKVYMRHI